MTALLSAVIAVPASAQSGLSTSTPPSAPHAAAAVEPTLGQYPEPIPGAAKRLSPDPAFAAYPQYRGSLDGRAIVLRIGEKPRGQQGDDDDEPGHLNGEYQYLPNGPVVLIAGSRDGNTLTLEESDDGTRITGQWVGFFAADGRLSGERMNNDESDPVPVALRAVAASSGRVLAPATAPSNTESDAPTNVPTYVPPSVPPSAPSQGRP